MSTETSPNRERLFSLDLLRGLDMFLLLVIGPFFRSLNKVHPLPKGVMEQFAHAWGGFTLWDIIMPLFIFMCGAAVPFALARRLDERGRPTAAYWRHVLFRVALLWFWGMVTQGNLLSLDPSVISPFNNTLQAIAAGYLAAAVVFAIPARAVQIAAPFACAALYGVLLHAFGDYTKEGNFAQTVERAVVPLLTPASSRVVDMGGGYTWWLSILMFAAMTLCGSEMARLLSAAQPKGVRARNVALAGAGLLAAGWALVPVVPCIKHIYTVSFTAQAMGWCTLALAFLFWLTDMCNLRRGLGVFILFGQTALFAYLLKNVFGGTLNAFAHHVTKGLPRLIGAQAQPLAVWAASTALLIALLYVWRERKTYRAKAK